MPSKELTTTTQLQLSL